jgi:demethylmenaquinone methyltransferase/2-methoxy-6-polyprenyl-1,4-benzoquinol methylase
MLQRAQAKSQHASRVFLLEGYALRLPFRDSLLDAVSIAFGLRNLADYERGLLEIRRVLKRGGLIAILEFSQLRWPLFGPLFRFYFHHILPRVGTWISGVSGPYQYLPDSVSKFPDQDSLATLLRKVGFNNVRYRNFTGGVAALHLGEKA